MANDPSTRSATSARRVAGSLSLAIRWSNASSSAKVEGTSASARPVPADRAVCSSEASVKCMPWPSSWASVITSSMRSVKFMST